MNLDFQMDLLNDTLLSYVLSNLDFRYVYSLRLTCKRFLRVSKKVHLRLNCDIFDNMCTKGTSAEYFSEILESEIKTYLDEDYEFCTKDTISKLCYLERSDLLEIFLEKNKNLDLFVLNDINYIKDIECFKLLIKYNFKIDKYVLFSTFDMSEEHVLLIIQNVLESNFFEALFQWSVIKNYNKIIYIMLNYKKINMEKYLDYMKEKLFLTLNKDLICNNKKYITNEIKQKILYKALMELNEEILEIFKKDGRIEIPEDKIRIEFFDNVERLKLMKKYQEYLSLSNFTINIINYGNIDWIKNYKINDIHFVLSYRGRNDLFDENFDEEYLRKYPVDKHEAHTIFKLKNEYMIEKYSRTIEKKNIFNSKIVFFDAALKYNHKNTIERFYPNTIEDKILYLTELECINSSIFILKDHSFPISINNNLILLNCDNEINEEILNHPLFEITPNVICDFEYHYCEINVLDLYLSKINSTTDIQELFERNILKEEQIKIFLKHKARITENILEKYIEDKNILRMLHKKLMERY